MRIASFDIGCVNFAFAVGKIKEKADDFPEIEYFIVERLCSSTTRPVVMYQQLYSFLEKYDHLWKTVDVILIEQQFAKAHRTNIKTLKLSQHVLSFFMLRYNFSHKGKLKIIEFPSYQKTKLFDKSFTKKADRKQWAVTKVMETITQTQDDVLHDWLSIYKKKDDIADCILMIWSYQKLQDF